MLLRSARRPSRSDLRHRVVYGSRRALPKVRHAESAMSQVKIFSSLCCGSVNRFEVYWLYHAPKASHWRESARLYERTRRRIFRITTFDGEDL